MPSKTEFEKFIMKVTLERPQENRNENNDVPVLEFWKHMGFEDIAEANH